jgi:hypothetical protein
LVRVINIVVRHVVAATIVISDIGGAKGSRKAVDKIVCRS